MLTHATSSSFHPLAAQRSVEMRHHERREVKLSLMTAHYKLPSQLPSHPLDNQQLKNSILKSDVSTNEISTDEISTDEISTTEVSIIEIPVLLFAALKDAAASDCIVVRVLLSPHMDLTVTDLLTQCAQQHPQLARWLPHVRVAVNCEYANAQQVVRAGDEVALLPPVAGGR